MDLPVMNQLIEQHKVIEAVTRVIERQLASIDKNGRPDLELIRLGVEYLRDFAEWRHHPIEEHLFAKAIDRDPLLGHVLKTVMAEHDLLPAETDRVVQRLGAATLGDIKAIAGELKAYCADQRRHVDREDREIFPRLRGLLPASDWTLPPDQPPNDPLINGEPGRFAPLLKALAL